ncbi:MAG: protein kinase [Thermoanaerobaculia bacterium]|jgi:serine/threonine protein kinase/Tol biopolymer transport system component
MPLANGSRLGPYEIVSRLGAGGMGEVYRAHDSRIGRDVAIKVLPDSIVRDPERLGRFKHEAVAAGMLNHPNLLTIYEFVETGGQPYMVSELLEGETLTEVIARGPIPQKRAVEYSLQIAKGLAAAHEKGIVHRDLKPDNIFVLGDERVKILDFGLAKVHPDFAGGAAGAAPATEPGMVLGTVGYMSPEQVRGAPLDQRSDIFSFGAILWEMLAGGRAFSRPSQIETLNAILKEDPPELGTINQRISQTLEKLVHRCLEKKKENRFQSARDLAFHLETLLSGDAASRAHAAQQQHPEHGDREPTARLQTPPPTTRVHTPARPLTAAGSVQTPAAAHSTATPRPKTQNVPRPTTTQAHMRPMPKPEKRASTPLLLLGAVVLLAAGALAEYAFNKRQDESKTTTFHRLTFRRGDLLGARFGPDGETVVYSAAWDGRLPELFMMRTSSPESKPFGIQNGDVAAISKSGEVAVILDVDRATGAGKLARVPLMGGQPRDVMADVLDAEWMPDGQNLAVIHRMGTEYRLEVPIGTVVLESQKRIGAIRISSDGTRVAFTQQNAGAFEIMMIEKGQPELLSKGWSKGVNGLAWAPDGKSLWFTAATGSEPPSLYSVKPGDEPRLVSRLTGALRLQDISKSGRVLLTHATWRSSLIFERATTPVAAAPVTGETIAAMAEASAATTSTAPPTDSAAPTSTAPLPPVVEASGALTGTDLTWLDWTVLNDVSADGELVLLSETREGGGSGSSIYVRRTDGSTPLRLGDGWGDSLSPDGKWVLAHLSRTKLVRMPTGAGTAEEIKTIDSFADGALWFPDGKRFVIFGSKGAGGAALYVQDVTGGEPVRVSPEGIWYAGVRSWTVSPDGRYVAGMDANRKLTIYPADGSKERPVPGVQPEEIPLQWSADGASIYVAKSNSLPASVYRVDVATGERTLWREIRPDDPAGVYRISPVVIARDGSFLAYNVLRSVADLYAADGLE